MPQEDLLAEFRESFPQEEVVVEEQPTEVPIGEQLPPPEVPTGEQNVPPSPEGTPPPPIPQPPSWEELSGGKVKSAEEFDRLYQLASQFKDNNDAVKVAQMWMTGEDIENLLDLRRTDFDKMPGEDVLYRDWAIKNPELAQSQELTPSELQEEFLEAMDKEYPGYKENYDPKKEFSGLQKTQDIKLRAQIEKLRSGYNESKKSALALKLEQAAVTSPEKPAPTNPEDLEAQLNARVKEAEGFGEFELAPIGDEKVSMKAPEGWKAVATAIAKDPIAALDARYFPEGKPMDHAKIQRESFILEHLPQIANYYFELGKGASAEQEAIAMGQKKAPEALPTQEAGGDPLEQLVGQMEAKRGLR